MENQKAAKYLLGGLAILSSLLTFLLNTGVFSNLSYLGQMAPIAIICVVFQLLSIIAALVLGIMCGVFIAGKNDKRAFGLVTVIVNAVLALINFSLAVAEPLFFGYFHFPVMQFIALIFGIGLLIAYIICNKKFAVAITEEAVAHVAGEGYNCAADSGENGFISLAVHIICLFFVGFVWNHIWVYKVTKYLNSRTPLKRGLAGVVLLNIFVPFYGVYWTYKSAQEVDRLAKLSGKQSDIATLCLVFSLLVPIVSPIIMQNKINELCGSTNTVASQSAASKPDDLKKYKELLDEGAITQEEYDKVKESYLSEFKN